MSEENQVELGVAAAPGVQEHAIITLIRSLDSEDSANHPLFNALAQFMKLGSVASAMSQNTNYFGLLKNTPYLQHRLHQSLGDYFKRKWSKTQVVDYLIEIQAQLDEIFLVGGELTVASLLVAIESKNNTYRQEIGGWLSAFRWDRLKLAVFNPSTHVRQLLDDICLHTIIGLVQYSGLFPREATPGYPRLTKGLIVARDYLIPPAALLYFYHHNSLPFILGVWAASLASRFSDRERFDLERCVVKKNNYAMSQAAVLTIYQLLVNVLLPAIATQSLLLCVVGVVMLGLLAGLRARTEGKLNPTAQWLMLVGVSYLSINIATEVLLANQITPGAECSMVDGPFEIEDATSFRHMLFGRSKMTLNVREESALLSCPESVTKGELSETFAKAVFKPDSGGGNRFLMWMPPGSDVAAEADSARQIFACAVDGVSYMTQCVFGVNNGSQLFNLISTRRIMSQPVVAECAAPVFVNQCPA